MQGRKHGGVSNSLETGKHYIFRKMKVTIVPVTKWPQIKLEKSGEIKLEPCVPCCLLSFFLSAQRPKEDDLTPYFDLTHHCALRTF